MSASGAIPGHRGENADWYTISVAFLFTGIIIGSIAVIVELTK